MLINNKSNISRKMSSEEKQAKQGLASLKKPVGDAADDGFILASPDGETTPLYYNAGPFNLAKGFLHERFLSGLRLEKTESSCNGINGLIT